MTTKLRPDLEERLKGVIRSKIQRLREAAIPPEEEEDEFQMEPEDEVPPANSQKPVGAEQPVNVPPANKPTNVPVNAAPANAAPTNMAPVNKPANAPTNAPTNAPVNAPVNRAAPANAPANTPPANAPVNIPGMEPVSDEPAVDDMGGDADQSKIRRAKVKLFFDKLGGNPSLMGYLNFTSPLEQAEAIIQFAEMVRVPKSQLLPLLKQIRTISQEPKAAPVGESVKKKSLREGEWDLPDEFRDGGEAGGGRPVDYSKMTLSQLANEIRKDWRSVNFGAKPYLDAMRSLDSINDKFYEDSGRSIVAYFLSNATTWRGVVAKAIKLELNKRLKSR